jgi:hypothetical protein
MWGHTHTHTCSPNFVKVKSSRLLQIDLQKTIPRKYNVVIQQKAEMFRI